MQSYKQREEYNSVGHRRRQPYSRGSTCCPIICAGPMGVDHGGQGDTSPRIWSRGTIMQIVPRRLSCSVAFKKRQNPFSAGAHDAPPDPLVGWRGDTPPHTLPHSAPIHLRLSLCVPQNSSQIYAYGVGHKKRTIFKSLYLVYMMTQKSYLHIKLFSTLSGVNTGLEFCHG